MKEFIEKHDENERKKSIKRFGDMSEHEKAKQSVTYRKQSVKSPDARHTNGEVKMHATERNGNIELTERSGDVNANDTNKNDRPDSGVENKGYEIPVYYSVTG